MKTYVEKISNSLGFNDRSIYDNSHEHVVATISCNERNIIQPIVKELKIKRNNDKVKEIRVKLIEDLGGICQNPNCNSEIGLQFHHISNKPNGNSGRGRNKRIYEIKNNPDRFWLLCRDCHKIADKSYCIDLEYTYLLGK